MSQISSLSAWTGMSSDSLVTPPSRRAGCATISGTSDPSDHSLRVSFLLGHTLAQSIYDSYHSVSRAHYSIIYRYVGDTALAASLLICDPAADSRRVAQTQSLPIDQRNKAGQHGARSTGFHMDCLCHRHSTRGHHCCSLHLHIPNSTRQIGACLNYCDLDADQFVGNGTPPAS